MFNINSSELRWFRKTLSLLEVSEINIISRFEEKFINDIFENKTARFDNSVYGLYKR